MHDLDISSSHTQLKVEGRHRKLICANHTEPVTSQIYAPSLDLRMTINPTTIWSYSWVAAGKLLKITPTSWLLIQEEKKQAVWVGLMEPQLPRKY